MSVDQVSTVETVTAAPRRPRRPTRRAVIVLVVALVLLLAAGGYALWALVLRPTTSSSTTYRTVTVATETLKQTVSASGTIQPARESALTFSTGGTVKSVKVEVGDTVAKGDTVATIDDSSLEIARDSASAELDQAAQSLSDLQDADDSTSAQLAAAEAAVKVKQSALDQAEADLEAATLKAPFSGKIAAVGFAKGDTVGSTTGSSSAGGGAGATTTASSTSKSITLISDGSYVVDTSVSVADVSSIKKGLQATITPTGSTDPVFGTVSSVGVVASSSSTTTTGSGSGSATFPVTVKVTGKQTSLLPGSSATVAITVKQLNDVIAVPTQAVSSTNGSTVVQKLVDGAQVATPVTIGQTIGASTVITKGLAVGDQVVVASFAVRAGTGNQQQGNGGAGGFGGNGPPGGFGGQGGPPGAGTGQGGTR